MSEETPETVHGGRLVAKRLKAHGVSRLFTLSGGHLFSVYDGCREEGIELVDVRHEATAAFAAEGWAKVTRQPGAAALTAGPGVTNGMSAIASAQQNGSPMVVLGGRAPAFRWGQGSLQELDHVPFVRPLTRFAGTPDATSEIPEMLDEAFAAAAGPPSGPAFVDLPLDHVFGVAPIDDRHDAAPVPRRADPVDDAALQRTTALLRDAERPVIMAGTGLYWGRAEEELRALAEAVGIPVFLNGLGRGCLPADHELAFARTRSAALKDADVALVIGVPMDFRLGFGGSFGPETQIVVADVAEPDRTPPRAVEAELYGDLRHALATLAEAAATGGAATRPWVQDLRRRETEARAGEREMLDDARSPLHPMRVFSALAEVLDRDAIVVVDGGDFGSFAGRVVDAYGPGRWLDPGPFGCLGSGPGYALAAKLARPQRQVVLLLGDGAFGFHGLEYDTLARHGVPVVGVMGNNGIWALEKHPMEALYGYSVIADLRPETRYDQVVEALGGHGELVRTPDELGPALARAFASGSPALVNVLTDPSVPYPRSSNLA